MIYLRIGIPLLLWIGIAGGFLALVSVSKGTGKKIGEGARLMEEPPTDPIAMEHARLAVEAHWRRLEAKAEDELERIEDELENWYKDFKNRPGP